MALENIGALVYLPDEKKIERYTADSMESFDEIDAYWMQREGLLFYPFDRSKQAYFFSNNPSENTITEFDLSPNEPLTQREYETSVYLACAGMETGDLEKVEIGRAHV